MNQLNRFAAAIALAFTATGSHAAAPAPSPSPSPSPSSIKNVVLVHGFFADGSGWRGVADILARDGYQVAIVQEPQTSLADDVSATTRAIDAMDGKVILVGHSYGGVVITQAGVDPKVAGLVYVAAFAPDAGESLLTLAKKTPPASDGIKATSDGHLYFNQAQFHADFAADLPAADAAFMARSQVMPAVQTASTPVTQAAWRTKPSWAIVSTADRTVNPDLERTMAARAGSHVVAIDGSHATFIVHPAEVAKVIEQAAAASH